MSETDRMHIEQTVEDVVAKYSFRNLRAMLIITFMAAGWATTLQMRLEKLLENDERQDLATRERIANWTPWRESVEERLRAGTGDRFTGTDYEVATWIFNMKMPAVEMPSLRMIRKEQGK